MPHPQFGQELFAPASEHQYHVQVFSKSHNDFISSFVENDEGEAHKIAKVVTEGYKGQYRTKAPKVRVVKVTRHTVYSEPQEVVQNPQAVTMAPTERRRLEKMLSDQAKGDNTARTRPVAPKKAKAPKKQTVDVSDLKLDETPKKKGK
jgi:hypothetical protein